MDVKPFLTAIVPTYKRPRFLKRAVRSILNQTYPNFEILISDNASGGETGEVIEQLKQKDQRIKAISLSSHVTAVENFQTALMQVETPYLCFLPDDDFYAPFYFEEVIDYFTHYPDIAFCGGGGVMIDASYQVKSILENHQTIPPSGYYSPPQALFEYFYSSFGIAFPSLIFKTSVLKGIGGFDLRICNGMDEHLISQISARFPVYLVTDRPFYYGFQHAHSLSAQINYPLFEREARFLHENILETPLSPNAKKEIDLFFIKRRLKILTNAYRYYLNRKEFRKARFYAEKVMELSPSGKWKIKKTSTTLFTYLPFLFSWNDKLKKLEKKLREASPSQLDEFSGEELKEPAIPIPDIEFLERYARDLDDPREELKAKL